MPREVTTGTCLWSYLPGLQAPEGELENQCVGNGSFLKEECFISGTPERLLLLLSP